LDQPAGDPASPFIRPAGVGCGFKGARQGSAFHQARNALIHQFYDSAQIIKFNNSLRLHTPVPINKEINFYPSPIKSEVIQRAMP
jgi:hypothetical protein